VAAASKINMEDGSGRRPVRDRLRSMLAPGSAASSALAMAAEVATALVPG
jgi:hypothetical protein